MEWATAYANLIKSLLDQQVALANRCPEDGIETFGVFDDEHGHYMLMGWGWHDQEYVQRRILHLRMKGEKICIEDAWTKEGIATDLLAAGVPNSDMMLGFQHPIMRPCTEFATA